MPGFERALRASLMMYNSRDISNCRPPMPLGALQARQGIQIPRLPNFSTLLGSLNLLFRRQSHTGHMGEDGDGQASSGVMIRMSFPL